VSHAGTAMLREVADLTGLSAQVTVVLADTYGGPWTHAPGAVFADLAAAVAGGADCIDGVGQRCGDRELAVSAAASTTTMWWLVDDKIDAAHLPGIRAARAHARQKAWAAGAAPDPGDWLHVDIDATITIDHSDRKEQAAPTWKKTFGHHGLFAFLDRPAIAGGQGLAGLLRRGNAGSNTAADQVSVLDSAMESLPPHYRPDPADPDGPKILVRCDAAGATHTVAEHCRSTGVGFSFGYPLDVRVRDAAEVLNQGQCWYPGIDSGGGIREGAWVAEATDLVDMSPWPVGTRLILRKERPHPGAQLNFTDSDGHRVTAFITDTALVSSRVNSPDSSYATANTPGWRTASARPRPPDCATCPATAPRPTLPGWKSSWPQPIWWHGHSWSGSPTMPSWPAARSTRSATASCTSPPASPRAPAKSGYASTRPGIGPPRSAKGGNDFGKPSPNQSDPVQPTQGTHRPWKAPLSVQWPSTVAGRWSYGAAVPVPGIISPGKCVRL
jgi:hypothetical protein